MSRSAIRAQARPRPIPTGAIMAKLAVLASVFAWAGTALALLMR